MRFSITLAVPLLIAVACTQPEPADTDTDETGPGDPSDWGELYDSPPQAFFAADLSEDVRTGVTTALVSASETWGNYGPLEYWVLGTDTDAGLALIAEYCERRDEQDHWDEDDCLEHQTRTDGMHSFMSYLLIGQEAVETGTPMTSMGWNGNRDWSTHLYTSSYPFGFDFLFGYTTPEEETKTLFHEYFHAVQQANIYSTNYSERDALAGPVWFMEGGAEYMAMYATSSLWASGDLPLSDPSNLPSFSQGMRYKMMGGLSNLKDNCPGKSLKDIGYEDACSYAAYELGAWAIAYLLQTNPDALVDTFYPQLNDLGWEATFSAAFGTSSEDFYAAFAVFLEQPLEAQMAILPAL